ncbi:hypothetical protein, conserved [Trypanosoma brucei gambiense DAL972]|uniref:Uncharacterized protein n=3 Tax=Trypanosoma brucei TaxID=5691 RepID=Q57ZI8_TRYB2|nr:hypothetical protein, conserved [Trypanosoma brucei gambiense DAL972]XP_846124.1 hypothetical protein, conserved [Trypanosoma brucei brucei TREU927]AAX79493.1 hypothetical protein, conserved [Trypanosoma brucei]RHW71608.1 hypothetical protein DPX39_070060800 [Trypanosoma brucei equiperdum]AAZ12565.1 hypothetical protein, conserved [Trypanosoma brucei brucei TREU927]CBH12673.1 hypothetical protein, conserved [Trypanosoma brucei gambiense DAL972]|eukprot:XP_011774953.1 hypothetical protein, conserved [Trypanosoma brucei gambiense DAL972]
MSHVTADLECFKCDMCGVYLHKDIFCNHRRECKGPHSTELKKSECRQIEAALNEKSRERLALQSASARPLVPAELMELHQQARIRREVANKYESEVERKIQERLAPERMLALAKFLAE